MKYAVIILGQSFFVAASETLSPDGTVEQISRNVSEAEAVRREVADLKISKINARLDDIEKRSRNLAGVRQRLEKEKSAKRETEKQLKAKVRNCALKIK